MCFGMPRVCRIWHRTAEKAAASLFYNDNHGSAPAALDRERTVFRRRKLSFLSAAAIDLSDRDFTQMAIPAYRRQNGVGRHRPPAMGTRALLSVGEPDTTEYAIKQRTRPKGLLLMFLAMLYTDLRQVHGC